MSTKIIQTSEKVKQWRTMTKQKMVESMGGQCSICGYSKCIENLAFHHLDPTQKDFGFGGMRANPKKWEKIVEELRKCICVCHNCHGEIHYGIVQIPENVKRFNENFSTLRFNKLEPCPVCGLDKPIFMITCSKNCGSSLSWSVDWESVDMQNKTNKQVADELGCSVSSVIKRIKKLQKEDAKLTKLVETSLCPVCEEVMPSIKKTCSRKCANKIKWKIDWDSINLVELINIHKSIVSVAKFLNVSDVAIHKRMKLLGISKLILPPLDSNQLPLV